MTIEQDENGEAVAAAATPTRLRDFFKKDFYKREFARLQNEQVDSTTVSSRQQRPALSTAGSQESMDRSFGSERSLDPDTQRRYRTIHRAEVEQGVGIATSPLKSVEMMRVSSTALPLHVQPKTASMT